MSTVSVEAKKCNVIISLRKKVTLSTRILSSKKLSTENSELNIKCKKKMFKKPT